MFEFVTKALDKRYLLTSCSSIQFLTTYLRICERYVEGLDFLVVFANFLKHECLQSGLRNTDGLLAQRQASSPQTDYFKNLKQL